MPEYFERRTGLAAQFVNQAHALVENGSGLYADICSAAALDLAGPSLLTDVLAPWDSGRVGDMMPLRIMGATHRLVLERQAPALALYYPSVGGAAPVDGASRTACYQAWVDTLVRHADRLPELLAQPPQTNEIGRAAALAGMLHVIAEAWDLPIRLHELGTSAGLHLRADHIRITWHDGAVGPVNSPVQLTDAWQGASIPAPSERLNVVERVGVDLYPVDLGSVEGRLHLTSFVWADQVARFERLRDALLLAERVPVVTVTGDLVDYVRGLELHDGTALVIWHSATWMYLSDADRAAVDEAIARLGAEATPRSPLVRIEREYHEYQVGASFPVRATWWPAPLSHQVAAGTALQYADSPAHGLPITWQVPTVVAPSV